MRLPGKLSIAHKLTLIVMVPSSAALILAAGALITYDYNAFDRANRDNLLFGARIVGSNCAAALVFDDAEAANRFLSALMVHQDIIAAFAYNREGNLFAQSIRPGIGDFSPPEHPPSYGFHSHGDQLLVSHPVVLNGERVGVICLVSDMSEMWEQLRRYILTVTPVILAAFLLALMLQRSLSPLLTVSLSHLAETAETVSRTKDYGLRARKYSNDEIGKLIDAFNGMLEQIQKQDEALLDAQIRLEERVRERTAELQTEIYERERVENNLRESEAKYRELVQNANSIILRMTSEGVVTYFNEFAQTFFGYSEAEILGKNVIGTIVPYADTGNRDLAAMILEIGRDPERFANNENENIKRNGERVWVVWTNKAILDEKGDVIEILCVGNDISQRKRVENALRKAKEDAEAANQGLEAAIERANRLAMQAELANNAKSLFLANMSHEIRTPMNGIMGMTGLLLETSLNTEQREFALTIRASSESLLELINDILDFSKIEAGKVRLEISDFDLRNTVEDVINLLWVRAEDKQLQLGCLINAKVPTLLRGDPGRLRQIIINLVGNAIKFTEQGEILVEVRVKRETASHAVIVFEINDTGIGITESDAHLLFQSFSQLDSTTTRKYGGTGLGLAISKQLVELMRGEIGVRSERGKGSTFWFCVPLEKQPPDRMIESVDTRGRHVLIVDGNDMQRRILAAQAESWACRTAEAPNEAAALGILRDAAQQGDPFDLALVDMVLPDNDGEAFCRNVNADPVLRKTKIILLSSLSKMPKDAKLKSIGAAACLPKPVKRSHLYECIVGVLTGHHVEEADTSFSAKPISSAQKQKIRILLVEDNVVNQRVALKILKKYGYDADVAGNGREALAACSHKHYDIILMDVQMPDMDGYEATAHIRDKQANSGQRSIIIAMTAHAMKGDRELCLSAGMDDYLAKPLEPRTMIGVLERYCPVEESPVETPPARESSGAVPLDRETLLRRVEGDEQVYREILEVFVSETPGQLAEARKALGEQDAELLTRLAHTVKGAAGNISAMPLSREAAQAEAAAHARDFTLAAVHLTNAETEFQRLKDFLGTGE